MFHILFRKWPPDVCWQLLWGTKTQSGAIKLKGQFTETANMKYLLSPHKVKLNRCEYSFKNLVCVVTLNMHYRLYFEEFEEYKVGVTPGGLSSLHLKMPGFIPAQFVLNILKNILHKELKSICRLFTLLYSNSRQCVVFAAVQEITSYECHHIVRPF